MTPELGRRLFQLRGWAPVPVLVAQLIWGDPQLSAVGLVVVASGELIRLWAVGHIGPASRTRGDDATQLVRSGPYGRLRNPLYVGNILMWVGVGAMSGPVWAAIWAAGLAIHYGAIVRWEESNLAQQLGAPYVAYRRATPRWLPLGRPTSGGHWSGWVAVKSERSTLAALAAVLTLVAL